MTKHYLKHWSTGWLFLNNLKNFENKRFMVKLYGVASVYKIKGEMRRKKERKTRDDDNRIWKY